MDAISSLSPEQQNFAKEFRKMQLETSLIAFSIIQIKPQLEFLLNLPNDSLTKEILLTENLLELFIKYQIPCDLLSFDGSDDEVVFNKINRVRELVKNMHEMLQISKDKSLNEKKTRNPIFASKIVTPIYVRSILARRYF